MSQYSESVSRTLPKCVTCQDINKGMLFIAEGESASSLTSAVAVSASTLAEDVRQLAQWCKSADDAREQQERRVEQLERMPPLQAHLKALQDKASTVATPPIPPHPIPPHPIPIHPIPSHPIPSHPIPSHPIPSPFIPPHPTPSHFIPVARLCSTPCNTTADCWAARCTAALTLAAAGPQGCKRILLQVACREGT